MKKRVLAIETSTMRGHLALVSGDGAVLAEESFVSERGHNATIFEPLGLVLAEAGKDLGWIVVGTGPGSYSGVRVGIAVANGLSLSTGAPVLGFPSLLAPGECSSADYWVAGDARRETFSIAEVKGGEMAREPELMGESEFVERVAELRVAGEVVLTFDERPLPVGNADADDGGAIEKDVPSAVRLARRVVAMSDEARVALLEAGARGLEPIYLRAPYITVPKGEGR